MSDHTTPTPPPSTLNLYGAPVFDSDGRVAGFILERRGVLHLDKRIDQSKHLFRKYNGYGIGDAALSAAQAAGARYARFHDDGRGLLYLADLSLFRTKGVCVNFGHGVQWILPLRHWTQPTGQDSEPAQAEPDAVQLGLFAGGVA